MAINFIFLGSGTSQGVPIIGYDYSPEYLANPKNHRTRPSLFVSSSYVSVVIDTTPEFRIQILRENIRWLDAILITHAHSDHIMGMDDCRRFCEIRGEKDPFLRPLPVYASQNSMYTIKRVFQYAFEHRPVPKTYFYPQPHIIEGPFDLGDLHIVPIALPHGHTTSTGFLFIQHHSKMLAYLSDTQALPEEVMGQVAGVNILIIDGLRRTPHPTHMCLDEALHAARRVNANRTILTHLNHEYDHDIDQAELPLNVELAYDGLRGTIE